MGFLDCLFGNNMNRHIEFYVTRTSPGLVPCHECGQLISPKSASCIKCKSPNPFALCVLCFEPARPSEAVPAHPPERRGVRGHLHLQCVCAILSRPKIRISCPDCGALLESQCSVGDPIELRFRSTDVPSRCQDCGNPDPWGARNCSWCALRIFRGYPVHSDSASDDMHEFCGRMCEKWW